MLELSSEEVNQMEESQRDGSYDSSSYESECSSGCSKSSCAGMCTDEMAYSPHEDDPNWIEDNTY